MPLGVEDGSGRRQGLVGEMVVADDDIDALVAGVAHFLHGLNAAVQGDDQGVAVLVSPVDALVGDAVALVVAVGYVVLDVGVEIAYEGVHQGDGRSPVHIVVSVDHDLLLRGYSLFQTVHSLVHILHQKGVMQLGEVGLEELAGPVGGGDTALYQEVGEDLVDTQLRREGADQSRVALLFNYPFFFD